MACERPAPEPRSRAATCSYTRIDTLALAAAARDTMARLKGGAQRISEITPVAGGIAFRTEDADSNAFHNGGAVSFDCAKQVTSVWLDGG
jgi:hypothetical protein